jgi:TRAP-type C4-dicarboxylate transport system substrate-binding protein
LLPLETLKGFKTGELIKYVTASWRVGSAYCFYVLMNKPKWDSLPADVKKVIADFSKEFVERWTVEWNNIDIGGREFFLQQGGRLESIPDADNPKWIKAVRPVIEDYKKDLVSKVMGQLNRRLIRFVTADCVLERPGRARKYLLV